MFAWGAFSSASFLQIPIDDLSAATQLAVMKLNIMQLTGSFHQGGSERQAVQLIRLLHQEGSFQVFPATLNREGVMLGELESIGFTNIPEYKLTSFFNANMIRQVRRCADYIKENDIRLIHSHDFYTNIFGMLAGRLAGVPVRIASKRETGGIRTRGQAFTERQAFKIANAITVNAGAVRDYLVEKQGVERSKISVIYNGLDLERLKPDAKLSREEICTLFGLPNSPKIQFVTIVANLRHDLKNYPMFLRSAKRVLSEVPEAHFVMAGEGELTGPMKQLAADLGISESCHFIGRCGRVPELLSISHVCILSSKFEGFSNSILEYMSAARPVVATNVGGANEAIIDGVTGFLVESDDDQNMSARIIELLQNPDMANKMGAEGSSRVETEFSLSSQLKNIVELYDSLLSEYA